MCNAKFSSSLGWKTCHSSRISQSLEFRITGFCDWLSKPSFKAAAHLIPSMCTGLSCAESDSVGLGWGPGVCISNELSGDVATLACPMMGHTALRDIS